MSAILFNERKENDCDDAAESEENCWIAANGSSNYEFQRICREDEEMNRRADAETAAKAGEKAKAMAMAKMVAKAPAADTLLECKQCYHSKAATNGYADTDGAWYCDACWDEYNAKQKLSEVAPVMVAIQLSAAAIVDAEEAAKAAAAIMGRVTRDELAMDDPSVLVPTDDLSIVNEEEEKAEVLIDNVSTPSPPVPVTETWRWRMLCTETEHGRLIARKQELPEETERIDNEVQRLMNEELAFARDIGTRAKKYEDFIIDLWASNA